MTADARLATDRPEELGGAAQYPALVRRVKAMVEAAVPEGAIVAVVSKGDPQLVDVPGRRAWHFPRAAGGRYAGHHPGDGKAAVSHLQELQAAGAGFLVFPATSRWWLDHYVELAAHLRDDHAVVVDDPSTGIVYALSGALGPVAGPVPQADRGDRDPVGSHTADLVRRAVPVDASVVVISGAPSRARAVARWRRVLPLASARPAQCCSELAAAADGHRLFVVVPADERALLEGAGSEAGQLLDQGRLVVDQRHVCTIYEVQAAQAAGPPPHPPA